MGLLKKIAVGAIELPATIFIKMIQFVFGATERYDDGTVKLNKAKQPLIMDGLLGWLLKGIAAIGRSISDFVATHKNVIVAAFWVSAAVAGAVALTLYLWPAALTTVAAYELYGYSIAGIIGADPLLQIGLAAVLSFITASIVTYVSAAAINIVTAIKNACYPAAEEIATPMQPVKNNDSQHKMMARLIKVPSPTTPVDEEQNTVDSPITPIVQQQELIYSQPLRTPSLKTDTTENQEPAQELTASV